MVQSTGKRADRALCPLSALYWKFLAVQMKTYLKGYLVIVLYTVTP